MIPTRIVPRSPPRTSSTACADVRGRRQRGARLVEQRAARVGQLDAVRRAVEERDAPLALQVADRRRDGGLDDVQAIGGARERALLGDGDEGLEVAQLHHGHHQTITISADERCGR